MFRPKKEPSSAIYAKDKPVVDLVLSKYSPTSQQKPLHTAGEKRQGKSRSDVPQHPSTTSTRRLDVFTISHYTAQGTFLEANLLLNWMKKVYNAVNPTNNAAFPGPIELK